MIYLTAVNSRLNGILAWLKPICKKKGDRRSPANYRGITLTSCLGKLFTSILQSRLNMHIEVHNILNPEQSEFRPNTPGQTLEQQIVYSSCNNSFISTPNNMTNFMLDLLVDLALAERDSKNAVVSFFCRWDLVCRPRVPSEDRGNWG